MRLHEIPPDDYVRDVLPLTAAIWAGPRTFDQYAEQTLEVARSLFGRRHYRTIGLYDGSTCVASFKRYDRTLRHGPRSLPAMGIGAVFTPLEYRGRGYASVMLAMALDTARRQGCRLAYLFSDIRPQFYAALGFHELPSRRFSLRADTLPAVRIELATLTGELWKDVRRLFEATKRRDAVSFARPAAAWEWMRLRMGHDAEHRASHRVNLLARGRRGIVAYVLGVRAPQRDAYVVEEFGFAGDASAAAIPALLRAAAGDLRRVIGWLPPAIARQALPRPVVRKRSRAIAMMAPLSSDGVQLLREIAAPSRGDFAWASEHV
jgi:GNAT superfamily N-acetyltransferase